MLTSTNYEHFNTILLEKISSSLERLSRALHKATGKGLFNSLLPLRLPRHDTTAGCRIWTKNKRKLKQRIAAELPTVLLMQISTGNLYRKCTLLLCRYKSKKKN